MDNNANENQMKNTLSFYIAFQVLRVFLKKILRYSNQIFYFLLFYISFYISRNHFSQIFRTSFNIIWKKDFRHNFSFYNGFTQPCPNPHLNGQNPLTVTKVFCRRSQKKIEMNLRMVYICKIKSSGKKNTKRWEEAECTLHCWPKSSDICDCSRPFWEF